MVDIFSKQKGPRREDVTAKRMINQNWPTISRLADQISDGGYTRSREAIANARKTPELDDLNIHILGGSSKVVEPDPIVRISRNNRVIVMDQRSGQQMQYLGELRFQSGQKYFALATEKNGFFATVDEDTETKLADLNGVIIESDTIQEQFVCAIKNRLDL